MAKVKTPAITDVTGIRAEHGVALYGRFFPTKVEGMGGIRTTLDLSTERGKTLIVAAGSPGTIDFDEHGCVHMVVCDATAFWDSEIDEATGEISEFVRTTFYDKEGRTFRTTSPYAAHFVARLLDVYGEERLRDGIPVTIRERTSKREKRTYHDFRPDCD